MPPEIEISDVLFWDYTNCDSVVWLDALKFFHLNPPERKNGFNLVNWELFNECKKFVDYMLKDLKDSKLIKDDSSLLELWIILENVECKILTPLFGETYRKSSN